MAQPYDPLQLGPPSLASTCLILNFHVPVVQLDPPDSAVSIAPSEQISVKRKIPVSISKYESSQCTLQNLVLMGVVPHSATPMTYLCRENIKNSLLNSNTANLFWTTFRLTPFSSQNIYMIIIDENMKNIGIGGPNGNMVL